MSKINITGMTESFDPFFRYTRCQINLSNLEGKSYKKATTIYNLDQISNDLGRDKKDLLQFLKLYFNCPFVDRKEGITCSQKITLDKMECAIKEFEQDFVLCQQCNLPETDWEKEKISKKKFKIKVICRACAKSYYLDEVKGKGHAFERVLERFNK